MSKIPDVSRGFFHKEKYQDVYPQRTDVFNRKMIKNVKSIGNGLHKNR